MKKEKKCPDCGKIKGVGEFGKRKTTSGNYIRSICKSCMTIRTKKWVDKNRKKFLDYQRNYYHSNKIEL